ncbi:MAG: IS630 family transposase [Cyanobacteria bacterium J06648_11]
MDVWAFDEHRLGLQPIVRKVWAPIAERPIAPVNPRYQWTYLYGFVHPQTGVTEWLILPRVNVEWFNRALKEFASAVGAGADKRILLVLDGAGWHRSHHLEVPEGIHLEFLPPYSPQLQPAERLWSLADEAIANQCFDSLDELEDMLAARCCQLLECQQQIQALTYYHWWP